MIDSNSIEEGPFGPDRTGSLPVRALIQLCYSGKMTRPRWTATSSATAAFSPTSARATWSKSSGASMPATPRPRRSSRPWSTDRERNRRDGRGARGQGRRGPAHRRHGALRAAGAAMRGTVEWIAPVRSIPAKTSCARWPMAYFVCSMGGRGEADGKSREHGEGQGTEGRGTRGRESRRRGSETARRQVSEAASRQVSKSARQ